jgi:hypothetical protein
MDRAMVKEHMTSVTFLGPVTNFGTKQGKRSYGFLMLQGGGGDPLKLEYPDKQQAADARNTLLKNDWSFAVTNLQLLYGIEKALKHSHQKGQSVARRQG